MQSFARPTTLARTAISTVRRTTSSFHSSARSREYYNNVSVETFKKQVLEAKGPVVVDFYATWCGPCKVLQPVLKKVTSAAGVDLVTLDVDEQQQIAADFQIRAMPTVMAFKDGKPVAQFVGAQPEPVVKKFVSGL